MEERKKKRRGKRKNKKNRKFHKGFYIIFAVVSTLVVFVAVVGLAIILLYKSGYAKLMESVEAKAPDAQRMTNTEDELVAREKAKLSTVEWQDNWVAIGEKIYAYDENCVNLLFLGIDKSGNVSEKSDFDNWEAGQTDAIFVVSLNKTTGKVNIVGIPRNSMVNVDIYDAENHKIDTVYDQICLQYAFAGGGTAGLERVKESVSELFYGMPIHGAFAVGYDAVGIINDMVGGIEVEVLEDLQKENKAFVRGKQLYLDGNLALAYVRSRNYGQVGSPTLRLKRQKQYITALINKTKEKVKENPLIVKDMYQAVSAYMNTDVTLEEVVYLAAEAVEYEFGENSFKLLEGEDRIVEIPEERLKPGEEIEPFYNDYYLDEEKVKELMLNTFYEEVLIGES